MLQQQESVKEQVNICVSVQAESQGVMGRAASLQCDVSCIDMCK